MSFFSIQANIQVYITYEHAHASKLTDEIRAELADKNINLLPSFSDYSFKTPLKNKATRRFLQSTIDDLNIDIVHVLFGSPKPIWFNGLKRVKTVITTRGSDVLIAIPALMESNTKVHLKYLYSKIKKAYINADLVTCTSITQKEKLIELGFRKDSELIKTGIDINMIRDVDVARFLPEELKGKNIIFSARYMTTVYNVEYQIEAIKKLSKEFLKEVTFVFIKGSNNNDLDYYNILISKLNSIKDFNYCVYDQVTQNQIWSILKYSKVVYMVPKSDGTPNSALECMAVNTPLIMGDLDYNEQLFKGVCLTAKLNDPSSLSSLIEKSVSSYPGELLEEGQRKVNKYGSRTVEMKKLQEAYNHLLK